MSPSTGLLPGRPAQSLRPGYAGIVTTPPDEPVRYTEIRALPQGDAEALQPVSQLLELGDRGRERACLLRAPAAALALARHAHGGDDDVAVHIQARAALNDHVHQTTSFSEDRNAPSGGASCLRFCGSRSRQQSTIPQAPAPYSLSGSQLQADAGVNQTTPAFSLRDGGGQSAAGTTPYHPPVASSLFHV